MSVEADLDDLQQRMEEAADARVWMNEHARGHAISNDPYGHLCENECFERALAIWLKQHDRKVKAEALHQAELEVLRIHEHGLDEGMGWHPSSEMFALWLSECAEGKSDWPLSKILEG